MMRIATPKAHALPSTLDERLAKIRKTSLTTQKEFFDSSCCLSFFFCVFIATTAEAALTWVGREDSEGAYPGRTSHRPALTTKD
jgi:hypothetical protein